MSCTLQFETLRKIHDIVQLMSNTDTSIHSCGERAELGRLAWPGLLL